MQKWKTLIVSSSHLSAIRLHTWLHHRTDSEISTSYLSPYDVPRSCIGGITPCIKGRGRRSGSSPASIGISGPVSRENRGDRVHEGQTSRRPARLLAFRGLWKCVHVEYDPKGNEIEKVSPLLLKDHPCSPPSYSSSSSRLGLFF